MNCSIKKVEGELEDLTEKLNKLIQQYEHKREYGDLHIHSDNPYYNEARLPTSDGNGTLSYELVYDMILGSKVFLAVDYYTKEKRFHFRSFPTYEEIETSDPSEVLTYFRENLENIGKQRKKHLESNAHYNKNHGIPLVDAVANLVDFAVTRDDYGPTPEELKFYAQYCEEIYT